MAGPSRGGAWYTSSSPGYCGITAGGERGNCDIGTKGNLAVSSKDAATWSTLTKACLRECAKCDRCRYVSMSVVEKDCSWFFCCDVKHLQQRPAGFRTGPAIRGRRAAFAAVGRQAANFSHATKAGMARALRAGNRSSMREADRPWGCTTPASPLHERMPPPSRGERGVLVGVISAPDNFARRSWLRPSYRRLAVAHVDVTYIIGVGCALEEDKRLLLDAERARHADITQVNASDCMTNGPTGNLLKKLAWLKHVTLTTGDRYAWFAKTDDDALLDLPKLALDLYSAAATVGTSCGRSEPLAYYGPMRWRIWDPLTYGVCGPFEETDPAQGISRALHQSRASHGRCSATVGPYPYADGSLVVVSSGLGRALFGPDASVFAGFHRGLSELCVKPVDDVALGYLIFAEAAARELPINYFALQKWHHNKFWFDLRDPSTMPDGETVGVHKLTLPVQMEIVTDRFLAHPRPANAERWVCADCRAAVPSTSATVRDVHGWGWRSHATTPFGAAPLAQFACCTKRKAPL
jgi:hypothetical protein